MPAECKQLHLCQKSIPLYIKEEGDMCFSHGIYWDYQPIVGMSSLMFVFIGYHNASVLNHSNSIMHSCVDASSA